jgi:hypothetical protein
MLLITAIGISPRIYDTPRDRVQEFLDGVHPMAPERKTYDTGSPKKIVLDQTGLGPSNIKEESDDKTPHSNLSSGYAQGLDPGGRVDDEVGPGNTSNIDPEQDLANSDTSETFFRSPGDFSSKLDPKNQESRRRDANPTPSLMRLLQRPLSPRHRANTNWLFKSV